MSEITNEERETAIRESADYADGAVEREYGPGVSRVTYIEMWADSYDAGRKLCKAISYINPVSSPGCGAVDHVALTWGAR